MSGFALMTVQKAIYDVLRTDATLLALLGTGDADSIFDNVRMSESATFPYIVFTGNTAQEFGTKTFNGSEVTFTISVFSQTGNRLEAGTILDRIYGLLHNASLTLDSGTAIICRWDGLSDIFIDDAEELITYQGVIRFRILTQE